VGLGILHASGYVIKTECPLTAYACYGISHNTKNRTNLCGHLIQGLGSVQVPSFNLEIKGWEQKPINKQHSTVIFTIKRNTKIKMWSLLICQLKKSFFFKITFTSVFYRRTQGVKNMHEDYF